MGCDGSIFPICKMMATVTNMWKSEFECVEYREYGNRKIGIIRNQMIVNEI